MIPESVNNSISQPVAVNRLREYAALSKMRLTTFVVISAVMGYFVAGTPFSWSVLIAVAVGGFLITASSNTFNQIIERRNDGLMKRTQDRPLPAGKLSVAETLVFAFATGIAGLTLLFWGAGAVTGWLGLLALFMYVAIYTPMKQHSAWAVVVGAFPGAMPPLLGYVAATGDFGFSAGILFAVQFAWQFPHFWAIAWKLDEDYKKAGYRLLPFGIKDKRASTYILISAIAVIPLSIWPIMKGMGNQASIIIALLIGLGQAYYAFQLWKTQTDKAALRLMFATFFYLPIILVAYML